MSSTENRPKYREPDGFIWDTYLKAAKDEDEARPKNWEGSTTGILTFVRMTSSDTGMIADKMITDRSFCCDCRGLHHRKLQTAIS